MMNLINKFSLSGRSFLSSNSSQLLKGTARGANFSKAKVVYFHGSTSSKPFAKPGDKIKAGENGFWCVGGEIGKERGAQSEAVSYALGISSSNNRAETVKPSGRLYRVRPLGLQETPLGVMWFPKGTEFLIEEVRPPNSAEKIRALFCLQNKIRIGMTALAIGVPNILMYGIEALGSLIL